MQSFRSLLFNIGFFSWSTLIVFVVAFLLPFPRRITQGVIRQWMHGTMWLLKTTVGLRYQVIGLENVPPGAAVFASKHESVWDTAIYYLLDPDPAYIVKKELLKIPLYGWTLRKAGHIAIDRDGGMSALKQVVRETRGALADGRKVVIFPEGTRSSPSAVGRYQPGVAAIYNDVDCPVLPVALNSGSFWGRRRFVKRPGMITLKILPPMPIGLDRKNFMTELQERIESESRKLRLKAEADYDIPRVEAPAPVE